jgi:hypothetical protein
MLNVSLQTWNIMPPNQQQPGTVTSQKEKMPALKRAVSDAALRADKPADKA